MKDWEQRTFARPALRDAALDTFTSLHLPDTQLYEKLCEAEHIRKDRFFSSSEGRSQQVQSQVKGVNHAPPSDGSIFGRPAAEVHRLLMDVSPLAPRADFSGVRTMLQRRAERHSAALDVYAARRTAGVDMLERWVAQQAAKATGDLAASLGAISTDMAVLERSRVMHLDEAALTGVWGSVALHLLQRAAVIYSLHTALASGEVDRSKVMHGLLLDLMRGLCDIAHMSEGEIERLLESKALEVNQSLLANQSAYAQLVSKLRVAEVEREKILRQEYDAACADWRQLRTRHAMDTFNATIRSPAFSEPPERLAIFARLRGTQDAAFAAITAHLATLPSLAPPMLGCAEGQRYANTCQSMSNEWDLQRNAQLQELQAHEDAVRELAHQRYLELVTECQAYRGYPEEELQAMLAADCGTVRDERSAAADTLLTQSTTFLVEQADKFRTLASSMGALAVQAGTEFESHKFGCKKMRQSVRRTLKAVRAAFGEADREREASLAAAMTALSQAHSEDDLDAKVSAALVKLDDIEEGYRKLSLDEIATSQAFPGQLLEHHQRYEVLLCTLLHLQTHYPAPEVVTKAEEPEAPEDGAAPGADPATPALLSPTVTKLEPETVPELESRLPEPATLATPSGSTWMIQQSLYAALMAVPLANNSTVPAISAAGKGGPVSGSNAAAGEHGGQEAGVERIGERVAGEAGAAPCTHEGSALLASVDLPESLLQEVLNQLATALLAYAETMLGEQVEEETEWSHASKISFTEELDSSLRAHRPRAGRIQEEARQRRSVQLMGQRRQVDIFVRAQLKAVQAQVDSFDSAKDTMMATLAAMLKRLSNYQKLLYACQSCTAIEIRKREVEKLAADFAAKAAADCTCLLATANETCDAIRTANRRFEADVLHSSEDGGEFAPKSVVAHKARIGEIDEHMEVVRAKEVFLAHTLQEVKLKESAELVQAITAQLPSHREDVGLLEAIHKTVGSAQRETARQLEASREAAAAIDADIVQLTALVSNVCPEGATEGAARYEAIVQVLNALRLKMVPRSKALQCLASSQMECRQVALPICAAGCPDENTFPPEETAAAAAAAAKGKAKLPPGAAAGAAEGLDPALPVPADAQPIQAKLTVLLASVRKQVKVDSDKYYLALKGDRTITRPEQIPKQQSELIDRTMQELADLELSCTQHVAEAVKKLRAQVVVLARELLCLPSAALAALTQHEVQHIMNATEAVCAPHTAVRAHTETERQRHVQGLRPALSHPMRRAELRALVDAEGERSAGSAAAAARVAHAVKHAVQTSARAADRRLLAATQQIATLLNGSLFLEDLCAAEEGDDSLAGLAARNALQLTRLDLAMKEASVTASEAAADGRPFAHIKVNADRASLSAVDLGWTPASAAAFAGGDSVDAAATPDAEAARGAAHVSLVDTPVQRALARAHNASVLRLGDAAKGKLVGQLAALQQQVRQCTAWKATWDGMVARVQSGSSSPP